MYPLRNYAMAFAHIPFSRRFRKKRFSLKREADHSCRILGVSIALDFYLTLQMFPNCSCLSQY